MYPPDIECIWHRLSNYQRSKEDFSSKTAAVLIPLFFNNSKLEVLFTKRQKRLNNHSGEVSFPGGGVEPDDNTLRDTALRETAEETGIEKEYVEIIGKLDDEVSITGFKVTPYVGFVRRSLDLEELEFDNLEVEKVFSVELKYFLNDEIKWTETWVRDGKSRVVYFYKYEDLIIWGLTGRILHKFLNIIRNCLV